MPKRKYKSLRTYLNARKRKEYNRYRKKYREIEQRLHKKGLEPYDNLPYTYQEYFSNKKEIINRKGTENVQRKMLNEQMYKFSYEQAIRLRKSAIQRGYEDIAEMSINEIRTGMEFDLTFLSDINEELKEMHPDWSGTQRKKYIEQEWFGYAS